MNISRTPEETLEKLKDIYSRLDKKYLEGANNVPFGCWIPDAVKYRGEHHDYYKEDYTEFFLTALNEFPNLIKLLDKDSL